MEEDVNRIHLKNTDISTNKIARLHEKVEQSTSSTRCNSSLSELPALKDREAELNKKLEPKNCKSKENLKIQWAKEQEFQSSSKKPLKSSFCDTSFKERKPMEERVSRIHLKKTGMYMSTKKHYTLQNVC